MLSLPKVVYETQRLKTPKPSDAIAFTAAAFKA
jgi:hypothetical protein